MHLHHRAFHHLDGIEHAIRGVSEGRGIDDHTGGADTGLLQPVDHLMLGIGLAKHQPEPSGLSHFAAGALHVSERIAAIDSRLAYAEQVQVRSVQDVDSASHLPFPNASPWISNRTLAVCPARRKCISLPVAGTTVVLQHQPVRAGSMEAVSEAPSAAMVAVGQ